MTKLNLYWYKDFLPQGLLTLLHKRKNVTLKEFIELVESYMSEEEKSFLFKKIHKEEGIDLNKFKSEKKEVPLFKSVSSEENESSENKNVIVVFSAVAEKDDQKRRIPNDKEKKPELNVKETNINIPEKTNENKTNDISLKATGIESKNF